MRRVAPAGWRRGERGFPGTRARHLTLQSPKGIAVRIRYFCAPALSSRSSYRNRYILGEGPRFRLQEVRARITSPTQPSFPAANGAPPALRSFRARSRCGCTWVTGHPRLMSTP